MELAIDTLIVLYTSSLSSPGGLGSQLATTGLRDVWWRPASTMIAATYLTWPCSGNERSLFMIFRNAMAPGSCWRLVRSCGVLLTLFTVLQAGLPVAAAEAQRLAVIAVTGSLPDGVGQDGLLADVSPQLHRMVERLDRAAADETVQGVLLSIRSPEIGRARAAELREAIGRIRAAGKLVVAHLVSGEPVDYAVAAACDTILMPPAANLALTGVRAEVTFFKGLLDRLGVQAEILQVGEFKGAGEPLTRESMSEPLRQQYEAFVGDLFEQLIEQVASDRGLAAERVRELIDIGVFTPEAARQAGLIDGIAYEDEAISGLAGRLAIDQPKLVRDYGKRDIDTDFSGLTGLMKLVEVFSGTPSGNRASTAGKVAVIHVRGEIVEGKGSVGMLGGEAAGSETIIKAIRQAVKDDSVAALVMRIDSPGGSALASDLIWRELDRCEKPVVASLSDTAASGGYYIAVASDRIVAAPGTLTGSIGVVGGKIAVGGALEAYGIHTDVVSRGRNAGWLSAQQPFAEHEREAFFATMQDIYRLFTSKVATGRQLDSEQLKKLAEGRVFTGRMALQAGLVDQLGTLDVAVAEAARLAGLEESTQPERLLLPEPRGLFDEFLGVDAGRSPSPAVVTRHLEQQLLAAVQRLAGFGPLRPTILEKMARQAKLLALVGSGEPLMLLPADVSVR
ncbi:MAG: signal peptide peptidase SppA [Planctomycetia bacterium]|nr:signal peptide peptidase SppA [Planctomycetia bacterium]